MAGRHLLNTTRRLSFKLSPQFGSLLTSAVATASSSISEQLRVLRGSVLEMMARRMTEEEAREMTRYWRIHDGPASKPEAKATPTTQEPVSLPKTVTLEPPPSLARANAFETIHLLHPHFGELVADLGYKKVYLTSVRALAHTPVWEKQRILRPERAARIAQAKIQKSNTRKPLDSASAMIGLSGVITMYVDEKTGKCGIVDGQHRAGALILLSQQGKWDELTRNILVDVFTTSSDEDVTELFKEINSAEPVRLVDMPGADAPATSVKAALDEAVDALANKYPEMFKVSARCRPPHLNADVLRDEIFQADVMSRHGLKTTKDLLRFLDKANAALAKKSDAQWEKLWTEATVDISIDDSAQAGAAPKARPKALDQALKKAKTQGFFLGLHKGWLHA